MPITPELAKRRKRIREVITRYPTQKAFADAIDFSESRLSKALSDKHISHERLLPLEHEISERKLWELETGQNDGGKGEPPQPEIPDELTRLPEGAPLPSGFTRLPLVEVSAGTGMEVDIVTVGEGEILPDWYIRSVYHIEPSRLCLLKVRGDSMNGSPAFIPPGSVLRAARVMANDTLKNGAIYAVFSPDGLLFKRLYFRSKSNGNGREIVRSVHLWSDNEDAGRDEIPVEVWERDYKVVAIALTVEKDL